MPKIYFYPIYYFNLMSIVSCRSPVCWNTVRPFYFRQPIYRTCSRNCSVRSMGEKLNVIATSSHKQELIEICKSFIPPLTKELYKGQHGRIGVIGGSKEYTGAPYFAGISSLKVGADLSHIFCTKDSSPTIKSYSPELIVHPILDSEKVEEEIRPWIDRLHSVVLGPGLGRDENVLRSLKGIVQYIKAKNLPLVIDADGLWLVTQDPLLVKGYQRAILTPNAVEFQRLYDSTKASSHETFLENKFSFLRELKSKGDDQMRQTIILSLVLENVTIVRKGQSDIISNGREVIISDSEGSLRRCGGQGDLLSGFLGTFTHWVYNLNPTKENALRLSPTLTASYAASLLTRECSLTAFQHHGRSTTASDLIARIHSVFSRVFDDF